MAAIHGRNGKLYVDVAANPTGTTTAIPFLADYSIDQQADRVETTSFGDTTKTYVAGLKDASGSISGFYNDASNDIYVVGDGKARAFILYVDDTSGTTRSPVPTGKGYWYGTGTFDVSTSGGVGDVVKLSINWSAASSVTKV